MPYKLLLDGVSAVILLSSMLCWMVVGAISRDAGDVAHLVEFEKTPSSGQSDQEEMVLADSVLPSSTTGSQLADLLLGIGRPPGSGVKSKPELLAWQNQDRVPGGNLRGLKLDSESLLVGQLGLIDLDAETPLVGAAVSIDFLRAGQQVLGDVAPDPAGIFAAQLEPGVYSMVAAGTEGFLGLSLRTLSGGPSEARGATRRDGLLFVSVVENEPEVQFRAAAVPRENFNELGKIIQRHQLFSVPPTLEGETAAAAEATLPVEVMDMSDFEVRLRPGGRLIGRAERLNQRSSSARRVRRMNVYFLQEGAEVARAQVDANGQFEVEGLPEGVLSIVIASREGFAAFSVLALLPENTADAATMRLVSTQGQAVSALEPEEADIFIPLMDPEDYEAMRQSMQRLPTEDAPDLAEALQQEEILTEVFPAALAPPSPLVPSGPIVTGGMPVSGGGGGGVGGGGAVIGGIALATGIVALAQDDGEKTVIASPFYP